ncbi:MAG: FkbM family methyltransferase [Lentisphaeria bacterium]|nr:FkbM family methyltransferase [Lentisphaeria bacterium]
MTQKRYDKADPPGEENKMSIPQKILISLSGNPFMQNVLEKIVQGSQNLMGIGSGTDVVSSGEQVVFRVLKQRLNPPYCIFDVGSNKGQFLKLILDHIAGDDFSVHCFEPGRETFKILESSFKTDKRIQLNNIAIGKEISEAKLYSNSAGSELASLTRRRLDHFGIDFNESEVIKINTIDHYCADKAIHHVHLLKLDIEGHEMDALTGAKGMFDAKSIDVVAFEFGGCDIDTRTFFQDFWYFFREINFNIFRITPSGYLHPVESYKEIHEQFRPTNFIAISNNQREQATANSSVG